MKTIREMFLGITFILVLTASATFADDPYFAGASVSTSGDLVAFFWLSQANWHVDNVSAITGQHIVGPVTSWQVPDGPFTVEHLAAASPKGDLLVFFWSPRADWQVVNVSAITGEHMASPLTSWVTGNVEQLAADRPNNKLSMFFRIGFGKLPNPNWGVCDIAKTACTVPK